MNRALSKEIVLFVWTIHKIVESNKTCNNLPTFASFSFAVQYYYKKKHRNEKPGYKDSNHTVNG